MKFDHVHGYEILDELREKGTLVKKMKCLSQRQRDILILSYGLSWETGIISRRELSYEELGKIYMTTRERMRQIEGQALRKLATEAERSRDTYLEQNITDTEMCYMIFATNGCEHFCPNNGFCCGGVAEKNCDGLISALLKKRPLKAPTNTLEAK